MCGCYRERECVWVCKYWCESSSVRFGAKVSACECVLVCWWAWICGMLRSDFEWCSDSKVFGYDEKNPSKIKLSIRQVQAKPFPLTGKVPNNWSRFLVSIQVWLPLSGIRSGECGWSSCFWALPDSLCPGPEFPETPKSGFPEPLPGSNGFDWSNEDDRLLATSSSRPEWKLYVRVFFEEVVYHSKSLCAS